MEGVPIASGRQLRVACIGAGAAGLCFAYKLQRSFEDFTLDVFEKNNGLGGTWFENTYPGCACDFPSHNYTYSFWPSANFSQTYSSSAEVLKYLEAFATAHDLHKYVRLGHQVKSAVWQADKGSWKLDVTDTKSNNTITGEFDIVVNASGVLNAPSTPNIPGLENFRGTKVHTAQWDPSIVLEGKTVGVIGNGSSGQQIVPAIQPVVKKLVHLIRQPAWTFGAFGEEPRKYSDEELQGFREEPDKLLAKRRAFEVVANSYWPVVLRNNPAQIYTRSMLEEKMRKLLAGEPNLDNMIPNYGVGCQRPATGFGYLEALTKENVEVVVAKQIAKIEENGVVTDDGRSFELDVLVYATGFDTSYVPRFPIIQQDGQNLQDVWKAQVDSYLATAVSQCPNYFTFCGPMNPFGSGAYLTSVEAQADYMLKFCDKWQAERVHSFTPKTAAVNDFMTYAKGILRDTVWTDNCRSWYKNHTTEADKVLAWPGSGLHFAEALEHPRYDDFDFVYAGNRFAWLGNGYSQTEADPQGDKAFYIRQRDDSAILGRDKQRKLFRRVQPEESPAAAAAVSTSADGTTDGS